ncbi:phagocyte signaling-impaired protein isoform X1 [Lutzomyia longipalpis]|uniref:phagocyte signaling-impaired protein isoform X1 n=1 Tax=Lutzomyia longipalpis TaxID=7200 RepID=UPI0024834DC3|nr:phagocyte signaling-impaired protein isoform X1 [Lutzomyia longipalpis]
MQHVQEAIAERRLRPIYDSLEVGNNKKALQEAEKVLKKNASMQCARALKALALLRLGRDDESEAIVKALADEDICDDPTLQVMTFCYRETDQLDKICSMYEKAVKLAPKNEEILSHLFMAYVRINDYKNQQTVALQLYRLRPKNPYYFWAVMSIVLQALRGPDRDKDAKKKVLLTLAQRMVDKLISEEKLDAEQDVQLYISILQYQEKYQEALEFLEGPVCKKLYPSAPVSIKIDLLMCLSKWVDLNLLMKQLLDDNRDRWDYYKIYIETCFELEDAQMSGEGTDHTMEMCHEFICLMMEGTKKVRGPYLARLELHRLLRERNKDPVPLLGEYLELLIEYFRLFGDKTCCALDIKMFLEYLPHHERPGFASRLIVECGISSTTLPQNKEQMQKHICSLQISRYVGVHSVLGTEHLEALHTALSLHYEHGVSAFGVDLMPTEIGPSDPYALLAVHVMYDLSQRIKASKHLVEALCLLQYLLSNSPTNFHAKLLSLKVYHYLGCGMGAMKIYETLDIKHIQLDSMGFIHCALLPTVGLPSIAKPLYDATLKFFTTSLKDSVEYLAMSYKFGSFSKLQEFMDFREKLANSLHYSLISVEAILMEIAESSFVGYCGTMAHNMSSFRSMRIHPEEDKIKWDHLTDNRDLAVVVRWDPTNVTTADGDIKCSDASVSSTKEMAVESFNQDRELLRLRVGLLHLTAACINLLTNRESTKDVRFSGIHMGLHEAWRGLFKHARDANYKPMSDQYLVNILPSRLHAILALPYEETFFALSDFVGCVFHGAENPKSRADTLGECFRSVASRLEAEITSHNQETDLIWNRRVIQERVVNCIEILSLCSFVLVCGYERFSGTSLASQQATKKNKKRDVEGNGESVIGGVGQVAEKERLVAIVDVLKGLRDQLSICDAALDSWKTPQVSNELLDSLAAMSLNPKVEATVSGIFRENHRLVVKELKNAIKEKIRMVQKS